MRAANLRRLADGPRLAQKPSPPCLWRVPPLQLPELEELGAQTRQWGQRTQYTPTPDG
jgi:hypothetical protein